MASFSRMQLAAALLEYDNDPDNPNVPRKSAYESAIFSHLRRANGNIHAKSEASRRSTDFLGVSLPSEAGATEERMNSRKSRATVTELYNPFGADEIDEEPEEEEHLEVDLASWGLDTFMPKEKGSRASRGMKGKAKSDVFPATNPDSTPQHGFSSTISEGGNRMPHSRTMSLPLNELGTEADALEEARRRNSISNPLDVAEFGGLEKPGPRKRFSSHPLIESLPIRPPLLSSTSFAENKDTIPFPSSSPIPEASREGSYAGSQVGSPPGGHGRTQSTASMGTMLSNNIDEMPNPFAIPPPPASRASRFDPKYAAATRTLSNATRLSAGPQAAYNDENENFSGPRAPSRASAMDMKTPRDRRVSAASFGTRNMLDDDFQSAYGGEEYMPPRERRYSRLDLMRPKVLIMPSPLQNATSSTAEINKPPPREGFLDSSDGRPLPPGAKTSGSRMSVLDPTLATNIPIPSNSFTPNPRLSLSASQLLFRNTLMVDGQRDVTYNDIDGELRRAEKDGEQVKLEIQEEPVVEKPKASPIADDPNPESKQRRLPGKLYGRSLIDDLEARKAEMRSKQRVFTGDQRPSMMDRKLTRSSTLIDPASLVRQPNQLESSNTEPNLQRRNSRGGQPLLAFDNNGVLAETGIRESVMPKSRSVFGVDKLWEREMEKLKEIEAQEKIDAEERRKREEEEETKKPKKKKKSKGKGKEVAKDLIDEPITAPFDTPVSPSRTNPTPSMTLPDIPKVTSDRRRNLTSATPRDDSDDESSASEAEPRQSQSSALREKAADNWVSDNEGGPIRTTGVGPRFPSHPPTATVADDSDEDIPLSMALQRATQFLGLPRAKPDDDSDEDRPLSTLLDKPKLTIPSVNFDNLGSSSSAAAKQDDDDEDDVPLGVRASRFPNSPLFSKMSGTSQAGPDADDDDRPLAMHPEQMRKSQLIFAAQAQQQQQMLQAQVYQSMIFQPQPNMMMMAPPMQFAAPASMPMEAQDPAKFNRVDKWRQDVAIEQS